MGEGLSGEGGPASLQGASSGRGGRRGSGGGKGGGESSRRKASKKDELRSKNREAQRRFREKQKCARAISHARMRAHMHACGRCMLRLSVACVTVSNMENACEADATPK
jgi:hypothetical protein